MIPSKQVMPQKNVVKSYAGNTVALQVERLRIHVSKLSCTVRLYTCTIHANMTLNFSYQKSVFVHDLFGSNIKKDLLTTKIKFYFQKCMYLKEDMLMFLFMFCFCNHQIYHSIFHYNRL